MNRGCIPLTKTPCKDAFKMFLKTKKFNEEQEKFLWKIWRIAWIYGKQYGAIQEEKYLPTTVELTVSLCLQIGE
jgi:hypothetical protein